MESDKDETETERERDRRESERERERGAIENGSTRAHILREAKIQGFTPNNVVGPDQ